MKGPGQTAKAEVEWAAKAKWVVVGAVVPLAPSTTKLDKNELGCPLSIETETLCKKGVGRESALI